jgi:ADP-heptose:LPS heptosyltransferase
MRRKHLRKDKVLLVNITRLGDMIQATPTIVGIKQENPNAHVAVLIEKSFAAVCESIPGIDEILPLDLSMMVQSLAREGEGILDAYEYFSDFVERLKEAKFDFCLNMSNSAYTALLLRLVDVPRMGGWVSDSEGYRRIESDWARLFASNVFFRNRHLNSLNLVDTFRASADVEMHPRKLMLNIEDDSLVFAREFLHSSFGDENGPLIAIQAGASQLKRQWNPAKFAHLIDILDRELDARILLTGTKSELPIIESVVAQSSARRVVVAAGKTNIPQLTALLSLADLLVTGDTGPMHISVAVDTPVVALFLASALCHETGPYSSGNVVLQPTIECGPCNPNKFCARPDCHDHISPELVADLVALRLGAPDFELPANLVDSSQVVVYRSQFDEFGFLEFVPLNPLEPSSENMMREAYRRLWMDDIGGMSYTENRAFQVKPLKSLNVVGDDTDTEVEVAFIEMASLARKGQALIDELYRVIRDTSLPGALLGDINVRLSELDRVIEESGFSSSLMGPLSRMFVFARENLEGTDALELASQMKRNYMDLERRSEKLRHYYGEVVRECGV